MTPRTPSPPSRRPERSPPADQQDGVGDAANFRSPLIDYVRTNLCVAPSGILSERYLRWAIAVAGSSRMLFSMDYPFEQASQAGARQFFEQADIDSRDGDQAG